jgi:hypothetical protein
MKILFLDIDGVLNSHAFWRRLKDEKKIIQDHKLDLLAIERLNQITDETGAKIVVSSTWRLPYVWNKQLDMLVTRLQKSGIKGEIIGMTPDHQKQYGRGGEIQDWMDHCGLQIDSFVILDDDSDMDHLMDHLVKTQFSDGLQELHVEAAIRILEKV